MLSFLKKRRKQKKLKKFLAHLNRLLRKRYGKSRYYSQGQVERTIKQEKLDKQFLWHGYLCFAGSGRGSSGQFINGDHPIPIDMEEVLSDIGEAFSLDVTASSTDMLQESIQETIDDWQSSGLDYGFDGDFDAGGDGGFDGGSFDGGGGDGGGGE